MDIGLIDQVHANGASLIEWMQTRFPGQSDFFCILSQLFAPRYAFRFYIPIIYFFNRNVGRRLLLVAIITEWVNQLMKWILQDERPYWWVHETLLYNYTRSLRPHIKQYSVTCENTPGSPSAHVSFMTSVWYVVLNSLLRKYGSATKNKSALQLLCWLIYALAIFVVSLSRIYLATHFPDQCILGVIIGSNVIMMMNRFTFNQMKLKDYIILTVTLFASSVLVYTILKMMGSDPIWSVYKAKKWCAKQDYTRLHVMPFNYVMRYCGLALGMGIGLNSVLFKAISHVKFTMLMKISCAIIYVSVIKLNEYIFLKSHSSYVQTFCFNLLLSYFFIAVVPFSVNKIKSII